MSRWEPATYWAPKNQEEEFLPPKVVDILRLEPRVVEVSCDLAEGGYLLLGPCSESHPLLAGAWRIAKFETTPSLRDLKQKRVVTLI